MALSARRARGDVFTNRPIPCQPALTRAQYAVAASVTLALFLAFYVAFGLFVLAQRWPRFRKLVEPKAVLKDPASKSLIPYFHTQTHHVEVSA